LADADWSNLAYSASVLPRAWQDYFAAGSNSAGRLATILTVSTLTRVIWPTRRTMYWGSSARLGSEVMPLRLSVETWY